MPAITPLPTLDRTAATFKTDVDDFFSSDLPTFVTQTNELAALMEITSGASAWVSGGSYSINDVAVSTLDYLLYKNTTGTNTTTDPRDDATNWELYSAGVVRETATQTLTNKTIDYANNTLTGVVGETATQTLTNKTLTSPTINTATINTATIDDASFTGEITEQVYALSGTTPSLNPANGTIQTWTLSANSTPTDGLTTGQNLTLFIDDGAGYFVTWPTITWKTSTGTAPVLATSGYTVINLFKVGSTLYGSVVGA